MRVIKKCPIPVTGLILAIFALGNILQKFAPMYKNVMAVFGVFFFVIFLLKIFTDFETVKDEMKKPPVASVFPTITMAIMIMATYIKPFSYAISNVVWWVGLIGHILLIIYFTMKFVVGFKIKTVFPSWYIVYVGIAVAGVTAPAVGQLGIGQASFWFGLITYLILLPIVLFRIYKVKDMPPPTMPSLAILAAPASLLLAAYMNSFVIKSTAIIWILVAFSVVFFVVGFYYIVKLISNKFIPTMSGFTFPMVISAVAINVTAGFFQKMGSPINWLIILGKAQIFIATIVVFYVIYGYINFLFKTEK